MHFCFLLPSNAFNLKVKKKKVIGPLNDSGVKTFLPDDVSHQEAERVLRGGAKVLPIYCYLLNIMSVGKKRH